MIIKEISTQTRNDDGTRPYLIRDSEKYTCSEWEIILQYLKRNAAAGLLKYEIIEP
jgi:hypothetical protein